MKKVKFNTKIIPSKKIEQIVAILKKTYKPTRLFLFGSQATGKAKQGSDYDFLVVVPERKGSVATNHSNSGTLIYQTIGIEADVFVYSENEFNKSKNELSSIPETALNTGKEIDLG